MELLGLSPLAWLVALGIVTVGATLQSTTGFGLGLVSAPVLVLLDPTLVPGVVLGLAVPLAMVMVIRERKDFDLLLVRWAMFGRIPGAVAGGWVVVTLGSRELSIVFALSLLTAVGLSLAGLSIKQTPATMFNTGFVSGMMGTATSVGGPFLALVFQNETGPRLRTTMAAFMAFGGLVSIVLLAAIGEFGLRDLALTTALIPAMWAGFGVSRWTTSFLDRGYTRPAVLSFAAVAAVVIIVRAL